MKEFLFVFRNDYKAVPQASPDEMQAEMKKWMDWIGGIAAQNKLVDRGNRLASGGKVVKANKVITDGPYTEIKELIGGYTLVKADSYDDAVSMAHGCPILSSGGNVEVREINPI
ncbi:MAG: YciI family protein [Sediminibacterium sp.]